MHDETTNRTKIRNIKGQPYEPVLHPDPTLAREGISITFLERFLEKVEFTETCILWKAGFTPRILRGKRKGGNIDVRRASWLIYNDEIPDGFYLMNLCPFGNRGCIHPNHIGYARRHGLRPDVTGHQPLTALQMNRLDLLCKQAGESKDIILKRILSNHSTPRWMLEEGYSITLAKRWNDNIDKISSPHGCWLWTASTNDSGYGMMGAIPIGIQKMRNISTHRISWMLHQGPIPKGQHVLHNCPSGDNPLCCNPAHLFIGTQKMNSDDAVKKQRLYKSKHWNAKISYADIISIRDLHSTGKITHVQIGKRFGVSASHISKIVNHQARYDFFKVFSISGVGAEHTHTGTTTIP